MISGFFISIITLIALFFLGLLPIGTLVIPQQFTDAVTLIVGYVNAYSWLLPVDQLFYALVFVLSVQLVILGFYLSIWVISLFKR